MAPEAVDTSSPGVIYADGNVDAGIGSGVASKCEVRSTTCNARNRVALCHRGLHDQVSWSVP